MTSHKIFTRQTIVFGLLIIFAFCLAETRSSVLSSMLTSETNHCNNFGLLKRNSDNNSPVDCFMCAKKLQIFSVLDKCCTNNSDYVQFCQIYLTGGILWLIYLYRIHTKKCSLYYLLHLCGIKLLKYKWSFHINKYILIFTKYTAIMCIITFELYIKQLCTIIHLSS